MTPLPLDSSRNTQAHEESSAGGPDFGMEVDWRLSRVRQEDLPPSRARATTSSREPPRRVVTATAELPASLAARLVLPGLPKAPSPGQQRDEETREGQQRRVQRGEASCDLRVVLNSREGPAEPRPKASLVVSVQSDGHGGAVRKVTGAAASAQWLYRDPKRAERGPNTTAQLLSWYRAGFYQSTLPVQRVGGEGAWTTLGDALLAPGHLHPSPTPKPLPKPLTQARSEATALCVQPEPPAAAVAVPPAPAVGEPTTAVEAVDALEAEAAEVEEAAIGWDAAAVQNAHRLFGAPPRTSFWPADALCSLRVSAQAMRRSCGSTATRLATRRALLAAETCWPGCWCAHLALSAHRWAVH